MLFFVGFLQIRWREDEIARSGSAGDHTCGHSPDLRNLSAFPIRIKP